MTCVEQNVDPVLGPLRSLLRSAASARRAASRKTCTSARVGSGFSRNASREGLVPFARAIDLAAMWASRSSNSYSTISGSAKPRVGEEGERGGETAS